MITIQKIGKLFILLLVVAGLASCNDDETAPFEVTGDAIIVKRKINDEIRYARYLYAYGNYPMTSAKVTPPEGGEITLESLYVNNYTYADIPDTSGFTTTLPDIGQFTFTVVNEDIEHVVNESLSFNDLDIPVIDSISYSNQTIFVGWELPATDKPDSYLVVLVDEDYESVFSGVLLSNTADRYVIANQSGTWAKTPVNGETYMVEVHAFKYESGFTADNYFLNANDLSIASAEVVWGEDLN